jgi:hypothetical protein
LKVEVALIEVPETPELAWQLDHRLEVEPKAKRDVRDCLEDEEGDGEAGAVIGLRTPT